MAPTSPVGALPRRPSVSTMENKATITRRAPFRLTRHSYIRLHQRTHVKVEDLLSLLKSGQDLKPKVLGPDRGRLFWAPADDCAYLAIYNYKSGVVLTIMPAYSFTDDGRFLGTSFVEYGVSGVAKRRVKTKHIRSLLQLQRRPSRPEFENPDAERAPGQTRLVATLRVTRYEGDHLMPTMAFGGFAVEHSAAEVSLHELVYKLREKLLKRYARGDARFWPVVHVSVELREKDAKFPAREIALPPRWFVQMEQADWYPDLDPEAAEDTILAPLMDYMRDESGEPIPQQQVAA